jgi:hypothetical protein
MSFLPLRVRARKGFPARPTGGMCSDRVWMLLVASRCGGAAPHGHDGGKGGHKLEGVKHTQTCRRVRVRSRRVDSGGGGASR